MKTSIAFLIFGVLATAVFYLIAMLAVEFITWGDAPWDMSGWQSQNRAAFALGATVWGVTSFFWITKD